MLCRSTARFRSKLELLQIPEFCQLYGQDTLPLADGRFLVFLRLREADPSS